MIDERRYKIFTDNKSIVVAESSYCGKTVRRTAKCNPIDTFDFEKGKQIAIAKVDYEIARRRAKRANMKANMARMTAVEADKYASAMVTYAMDAANEYCEAEFRLNKLVLGE